VVRRGVLRITPERPPGAQIAAPPAGAPPFPSKDPRKLPAHATLGLTLMGSAAGFRSMGPTFSMICGADALGTRGDCPELGSSWEARTGIEDEDDDLVGSIELCARGRRALDGS
jgi:hypothetical protein